MTLKDAYTSVQGTVTDAVRPMDVPQVALSEGACVLLRPKSLFCDPICPGGQTCAEDGLCVPLPSNQDVGVVTIGGLTAAVELEARAPVYFYNHVGALPHPAFEHGQPIDLSSTTGLRMATAGVAPLEIALDALALEADQPASLLWTPASEHQAVGVEIELNIANHGGTPARVVCHSDDNGRFDVPAAMVNALLALGYSGYPSVAVTRAASNTAEVDGGCVEFRAQSTVVLMVEIEGLVSCSEHGDCPDGQRCQADLTCG
jgi:hypothetical protein